MLHQLEQPHTLPDPEALVEAFEMLQFPDTVHVHRLHEMDGRPDQLEQYPPSVILGTLSLAHSLAAELPIRRSPSSKDAVEFNVSASKIFGAYAIMDSRNLSLDTMPRITPLQIAVAKHLHRGVSRAYPNAQAVVAQGMRALEWYADHQPRGRK